MTQTCAVSDPASEAEVAFILVHYKTPRRLQVAVADALEELNATGRTFAVVVVDNSGDVSIEAHPSVRVITPGSNLGYAGATNLAVRSVSASHYLLSNPDVKMLGRLSGVAAPPELRSQFSSREPGEFVQELLSRCPKSGAAGPRLFWDEDLRLQLPPTEQPAKSFGSRAMVRFSPKIALQKCRSAWRKHARKQWSARQPFSTSHLSGAMLMMSRRALGRVGPFDENFRLYFEETDWLVRAARVGIETAFVPSAIAIHEFDQSAKGEPAADGWFAESEDLFRRRYDVRGFTSSLSQALSAAAVKETEPLKVWPGEFTPPQGSRELWFELAPRPERFPAAAEQIRLKDEDFHHPIRWQLPASIANRVSGWWLTISDEHAEEIGAFRIA